MNEKPLRIIAVITARGGSKGLPGKNIIDLAGKPLLAYTVEAALQSRYVETTVVSTDDEKIREVALAAGAEAPFLRPAELASDTAHSPDVVSHAVEYYEKRDGKDYDLTVMLQPTSPFRTGRHIDEAIEKFLEDRTLDSLISIKKQDYPPWWMFTTEGARLRPAFHFKDGVNVFNLERQEFPTVYRPNGAIYVTWREYLKKTGSIVNPENNGYYVMSEADSIDIDLKADLYAAEYEMQLRLGNTVT
ncbi:MAG: acylneuraminate cytidylyltransferase family protein [Candidatus Omnitrophica bacterium]|nr:acylneuraminate cytidylyltransferase family protein [Candidatus Omnitrophota bacterium]